LNHSIRPESERRRKPMPLPEPADVLRAFIEFEERAGLFDRRARGVPYWQLIRHDVFRETLQALGLAAPAHRRIEELPLHQWMGPQLRQLPRTLARSVWSTLRPAELLVAAHPRHLAYQGRFVCPYTQPLLWSSPRSRVVMTGHFQGRYFAPDAGERTRYVDLSLVLAHAAFRARELRGGGLSRAELAELAEIAAGLHLQLGAAALASAIERRARTAVLTVLGMRSRLSQLLDRVQPRLIVEVVGYRLVNQVLALLARERGIPIAELQHGTLGAAHPAYNFAPGRRPESFPDHLLLFGALWREATPGLPLMAANTPALGYAWLELQRQVYVRLRGAGPRRVLFLSQGSIGRELARVAAELRQRLPRDEFEIVYRLHPSEAPDWQQAYPELARADLRVESAAQRPLYATQSDSDVQVGVYSTALLEGVAFGLETYLVALPGHEQLALLTAAGIARLVPDAASLAAALRDASAAGSVRQDAQVGVAAAPRNPRGPHPTPVSGNPREQSAATAGESLWASGASHNFNRFVDRVLNPANGRPKA
jgi:hypothetical protein